MRNNLVHFSGLESVRNRLDWDFLGKYIFWMFVQGTIFIIITLVVEYKLWTLLICRRKNDVSNNDIDTEALDEDVIDERTRVLKDSGTDVLQVKNIFKRFILLVDILI